MAKVSRLAGALLAQTSDRYFLIGDLKQPCDWASHGFETPREAPNGLNPPYIELTVVGRVTHTEPGLHLTLEGESLASVLAQRFLIRRNGSVSERLWELVTEPSPLATAVPVVEADWLSQMPEEVWNVVRDAMLRCV